MTGSSIITEAHKNSTDIVPRAGTGKITFVEVISCYGFGTAVREVLSTKPVLPSLLLLTREISVINLQ
jgi:hypothetical protein